MMDFSNRTLKNCHEIIHPLFYFFEESNHYVLGGRALARSQETWAPALHLPVVFVSWGDLCDIPGLPPPPLICKMGKELLPKVNVVYDKALPALPGCTYGIIIILLI